MNVWERLSRIVESDVHLDQRFVKLIGDIRATVMSAEERIKRGDLEDAEAFVSLIVEESTELLDMILNAPKNEAMVSGNSTSHGAGAEDETEVEEVY